MGIILDQTLALGADEWKDVLAFLKKVVNGLGVSSAPGGARVGLIRFSSRPFVSLYFNTIRDENLTPYTVNKFIDSVTQIQGVRRIDLALQRATDLFTNRGGSPPNAKKVGHLSLLLEPPNFLSHRGYQILRYYKEFSLEIMLLLTLFMSSTLHQQLGISSPCLHIT